MSQERTEHGAAGISAEGVAMLMADAGATRLYIKYLAPNDNRKNQPYFGGSFDVLNILPLASDFEVQRPDSSKRTVTKTTMRMKAKLNFSWLSSDGNEFRAPNAQLILYPQYPEVRFSGFLRGAGWAPKDLMDESRRGRDPGRVLFIGVRANGTIVGYLAAPESQAARDAHGMALQPTVAVFSELDLSMIAGRGSHRDRLLRELARIHRTGWITGKALWADGTLRDCQSGNCGGYTLEAELGILPNGYADPDFFGWEIKQNDVGQLVRPRNHVVTLLTPNPDSGEYSELPLAAFVRRYGYSDRRGRADRMNFGGVHRFGERQRLTGLTLGLRGFDPDTPKTFDADGALILETDDGTIAAAWTFAKLLSHWNRKHDRAAFVPSERSDGRPRCYRFGQTVQLGEGTDFPRLLGAIAGQYVYYDPGIKLVEHEGATPQTKSRSQFRMKSAGLAALYERWSELDVLTGEPTTA